MKESAFNNPEIPPSESRLFQREKAIIDRITPQNRKLLLSLRRDNLVKERAHIVGVRSEDLIHFLECLERGYIPVGGEGIRGKAETLDHLYITSNPESQYLQTYEPDLIEEQDRGLHFKDFTLKNIRLYSEVAAIQAFRREIISDLDESELVEKELARIRARENGNVMIGEAREEFYKDFSKYIRGGAKEQSMKDLQVALKSKPEILERYKDLVPLLPSRGGIILAFSDKLTKQYKGTVDRRVIHDDSEIAFPVPSGKLSLDVIYGFEPLGDFEDAILEQLEEGL